MPESVVESLRFTGMAKFGVFVPGDQVFYNPRELVLGAVRITINGQRSGRSHDTEVDLSFANGVRVNYTRPDVIDGEPTTSVFPQQSVSPGCRIQLQARFIRPKL